MALITGLSHWKRLCRKSFRFLPSVLCIFLAVQPAVSRCESSSSPLRALPVDSQKTMFASDKSAEGEEDPGVDSGVTFAQLEEMVVTPEGGERPAGEDRPLQLDDVVVTSVKQAAAFQTGDVDFELTPVFFTVIDRLQFEGKIMDVGEILKKETGIQIRRAGGMGSFSQVSIRGSSSEQVMIYLDGIALNDASGGGVNLGNLSLSDVKQIEAFRGFTPINFGSASIGGAVNIKTLRSEKGLKTDVSAGGGSFGTYQGGGYVNYKPSEWDCLLSFDYLESDNDFEFDNDMGTQYNTADDRAEKRRNAGFDQTSLLGKVGYDFSENTRLDLLNQYFSKHQQIPDWRNNESTRTSLDTERNVTALKLTADNLGYPGFNTAATFTHVYKEEEYDDSLGQIGLGKQHTVDETRRLGTQVFGEWLTEKNSLQVSLEFNCETYEPEDKLKDIPARDSDRRLFNAGVQDTVLLMDERLMITPSLRYTYIKDKLESATSAYGISLEERDRDNSYAVPQVGVKYAMTDDLSLKSNLGQYVREPSFYELFGDRGLFLGNTDLEEEKGVNFDIGLEYRKTFETARVNSISFRTTYFHSKIDDLITRSFDARGVGKSVNLAEARIYGLETGMQIAFLNRFNFIANVTMQETENLEDNKAYKGKKLPGRWRNAYMARLEAVFGDFTLYGEYVGDRDMYYDTPNLLEAEDKDEFNLGVKWSRGKWRAELEARNVGDEQYEDFNGFPMPGRSFYFKIGFTPFGGDE